MDTIINNFAALFDDVISTLVPAGSNHSALIQFTKDSALGEIQCNSAMALARELGQNPRQIAEKLVSSIDTNPAVQSVEIAGPGFINIRLSPEYMVSYLESQSSGVLHPIQKTENPVIIDYSSPNIAKRMHIGHLRSTIQGDALKRIFTALGYRVIGDNHIGDWGTQFGKLIVGYRLWLDKEVYNESPIEELERIYVKFEQESAEQPELLEEARQELKKLQDGDAGNKALWQEFIDSSLAEYQKIYSRLGISFDTHRGESYYHDKMPALISNLTEKGLAVESEAALVVFFDESEHLHPCIVQKKDGAFLYATSDLACIQTRMKDYNPQLIVYVTDDRQIQHFKQVFRIAERMGWQVNCEHVSFGIMKFADGHFSTRKGNVIFLSDLLDEAERRAFEIVTEKNPALEEAERREIARIVGTGAVKYFDLSQNRNSAIVFDWDKALSFEGNTSPYLQYVYARIQSIMRKAELEQIPVPSSCPEPSSGERKLMHSLLQYSNVVAQAATAFRPNIIADYLYDLSQAFNSFYNSHPVLKEEQDTRNFRLYLCQQTAGIIKNGLELLGIEVLARM